MSKLRVFLIVAAASFGLTACTKCSEDKPAVVEQPAAVAAPDASASPTDPAAANGAAGEAMPAQPPGEDPAAPMDDDSGKSDGQAPQGQAQ
jgi:hypothetical protein